MFSLGVYLGDLMIDKNLNLVANRLVNAFLKIKLCE